VIGLAAGKILGKPLGPYDFKGGLKSKCFRILETHGFTIVTKASKVHFQMRSMTTSGTLRELRSK
jgi:hypothetical protein